MRRPEYKSSKVRTAGFVLIAASVALAVVDATSLAARGAELTNTLKDPNAISQLRERVSGVHQADSLQARTPSQSQLKAPQSSTPAHSLAGLDPRKNPNNPDNHIESSAKKLGKSATEAARDLSANTQEAAKSIGHKTSQSRDFDYADNIRKPVAQEPRTIDTSTSAQAYHHESDRDLNTYPKKSQQPSPPIKSTQHDYDSIAAKPTYHPEKTERRVVAQSAASTYTETPSYTAAAHDVKVEISQELPSTGPGLATTLSLGGIVAALVARKLFYH